MKHEKEKVAIIGSGPAGLTCAFHLARKGYLPTIFESLPVKGGMLRTGIPAYRLPREVLDREIRFIEDSGVEIKTSSPLGGHRTLASLRREGYKAFFIATGAHLGREVELEGLELEGVMNGVEFLRRVHLGEVVEVGRKVLVVGGGNVAVDVARVTLRRYVPPDELTYPVDTARSALRLGVEEVSLICLEPEEEMPAYREEIEGALEEGVRLLSSLGPKRILGDRGKVTGLETWVCESVLDKKGNFSPRFLKGSEKVLEGDTVILAIGQRSDLSFLYLEFGLEPTEWGTLKVNPETLATTSPGVFAGGDVVFGPRSVVESIADGQRAARFIHHYLRGEEVKESKSLVSQRLQDPKTPETLETTSSPPRMVNDYDGLYRQEMPILSLERRGGHDEVELGFDEERAQKEASRCLRCDLSITINPEACVGCGMCSDACPYNCIDMVTRNGNPDPRYRPWNEGRAIYREEKLCIRCGICYEICEVNAIQFSRDGYMVK